jgi:hypothetical protein
MPVNLLTSALALLQIAARCGGTTQRHDSTIVLPDGGLSLNCHAMLMF